MASFLIDGYRFREVGRQMYLVQSKSNPEHWHITEFDDVEERWECSCVSWMSRESCSHVRAIRRWDDGE